jgi:hypothetical protein
MIFLSRFPLTPPLFPSHLPLLLLSIIPPPSPTLTIEKLDTLWKDGAESPFFKYPNELSLHILVFLPLSPACRTKHFDKLIFSEPNVNVRWKRSR